MVTSSGSARSRENNILFNGEHPFWVFSYVSAMKGDKIMQINLEAKAPDVYQVQAAPTNKNDLAIKIVGLGCLTAIALSYIGVLYFTNRKGDK